MARLAVIDDGVVTNVIEAEEGFTIPGKTLVAAGNAGIGWGYADETFSPPATISPSNADVIAERDRRLCMGFDHDFGDDRGVHRIGTTPEDMRKWLDEVTPIAQAFINAGMSNGEITIFTNTGNVTVTAAEWQLILLAAGQWRQPIYQAGFVLSAMDPIPADFSDNTYWPD